MSPDEIAIVKDRIKADYDKFKRDSAGCNPADAWKPVLTEQEKSELKAYIKLHNLPF